MNELKLVQNGIEQFLNCLPQTEMLIDTKMIERCYPERFWKMDVARATEADLEGLIEDTPEEGRDELRNTLKAAKILESADFSQDVDVLSQVVYLFEENQIAFSYGAIREVVCANIRRAIDRDFYFENFIDYVGKDKLEENSIVIDDVVFELGNACAYLKDGVKDLPMSALAEWDFVRGYIMGTVDKRCGSLKTIIPELVRLARELELNINKELQDNLMQRDKDIEDLEDLVPRLGGGDKQKD